MAFVKRNKEHNGIELYFTSKPAASVLNKLKENGWRWHKAKKCWYNRYSDYNYSFANKLCNDENGYVAPDKSLRTQKKKLEIALKNDKKCGFSVGEFVEFESDSFGTQYGKIKKINFSAETAEIEYHYISRYSKTEHDFTDYSISWNDIKKYSVSKLDLKSSVNDETTHRIDPADEVYEQYGLRRGDKVTFTTYDGYDAEGKITSIYSISNVYVEYTYIAYGKKQTGYSSFPAHMLIKSVAYRKYDYEQLSEEKKKEIDFNEEVKNRIKSRVDNFSEITPTQKQNKLYKHQRAGCLLAERYDRFAFFYDTGTGKTVMALDIINSKYRKDGTKFLIIAPKAIIQTAWMEDARNYYPEMRILPLTTNFKENKRRKLLEQWKTPEKARLSSFLLNRQDNYLDFLAMITGNEEFLDIDDEDDNRTIGDMVQHYIINAELFIRNPEKYISELGVNGLVVDESAVMKNYQSITSNAIIEAASKMKYVYLLSGKPAPNNELEYFSQMKSVDPDTFHMSYSKFASDFGVDDSQRNVWLDNEAKETLSKLISARSLIISKDDCLDLLPTTEVVHQFELPEDIMREYDRLYENCLAVIKGMDKSTRVYTSASKLAVLMKLRQMASGFFIINNEDGRKSESEIIPIHDSKIEELENIINQIDDEQVIIWCQFKYEIKRVEELLSKYGKVVTAFGGTKDVNESIADFKEGRAKYIVAHPKTLKYGVTFTNCRYAVYYSFSYSAEDYDQSHDRIYRLGQKQKCTFYFLQAENTIDELMYQKVMNKLSNAEFFEWLIKDASTHGIDYDRLKERDDDDYSGISDELIAGMVEDRKELIEDRGIDLLPILDESIGDSYGEFWIQEKTEAEKEIDELIELTYLYPTDLKKLREAISGMFDKFENNHNCSSSLLTVKYRHCLDLVGNLRNKRTWDEVSRRVGRSKPWVSEKYKSIIRKIRIEYKEVLEYMAGVYILGKEPERTYRVKRDLFDFLTPPDPTYEEIAELELPIVPSEFVHVKEGESVKLDVGTYREENIYFSAGEIYFDWGGNLRLKLIVDASDTVADIKYTIDDIVIINGFQKERYKKQISKWTEAREIVYEALDLGPLSFDISEDDEIDVYLTIWSNDNESRRKKIHFHTSLRKSNRISLDSSYLKEKQEYSLDDEHTEEVSFDDVIDATEKIQVDIVKDNKEYLPDIEILPIIDENPSKSDEFLSEKQDVNIPLADNIPNISIAKVYKDGLGLRFVFKADIKIVNQDDSEIEFISFAINGKKIEKRLYGIETDFVGTLYDEQLIYSEYIEDIDISIGNKVEIQYSYEFNVDNEIIQTVNKSCLCVIENEQKKAINYSDMYKTDQQVIYKDNNVEIIFIAALKKYEEIRWLIYMKNFSGKNQEFRINYARINDICFEVNDSISVDPFEQKLELVKYKNPMEINILNQNIILKADNHEWMSRDRIEYNCNPFIIGEVYDDMYSPSFSKLMIDDDLELFKPGVHFGESRVGAIIFESCEDETDSWWPSYKLKFIYNPALLGKVEVKFYINGFCIFSESEKIKKKELLNINLELNQQDLRYHGIKENETYNFKVKVLISLSRKNDETVYMEKEYRMCLSELVASPGINDIPADQLKSFEELGKILDRGNHGSYIEKRANLFNKVQQGIYDDEVFEMICSISGWKVKETGSFFSKVPCFEDYKIAVKELLPKLSQLFSENGLDFNEHILSDHEEYGDCIVYTSSGEEKGISSLRWKKMDPYLAEYILKYSEMSFRQYVCYEFLTWPEELTTFMKLKYNNGSRFNFLAIDKSIQQRQKKYINLYPQITTTIKNSLDEYLKQNGEKWTATKEKFISEK